MYVGVSAMSDWKALIGRVTLFPAPFLPNPVPSALDLYRSVWKLDPDSFQGQSGLSPSFAQGRRQSVLSAQCSSHPSRIDFTLARQSLDSGLPPTVDAGPLRDELSLILEKINNGLVTEPIIRVSVFLQFVSQAATHVEANKILIDVIPQKYGLKLTDEEDFSFQINQRQQSTDDIIMMNYITKWSVERVQITVNQFFAGGYITAPAQTAPESLFASVAFDNNCVPSHTALSANQQSVLLRDCLAGAEEQRRLQLNVLGL
jgi:hypothetical protein